MLCVWSGGLVSRFSIRTQRDLRSRVEEQAYDAGGGDAVTTRIVYLASWLLVIASTSLRISHFNNVTESKVPGHNHSDLPAVQMILNSPCLRGPIPSGTSGLGGPEMTCLWTADIQYPATEPWPVTT